MFDRDTSKRDTSHRDIGPTGHGSRTARPATSPPQVFAKLEIGAVDSPFEREADRVAGQVMRKLDSDGAGGGDVMTRMESAFGADFSGVRIHTGREAAGMSATIQAKAFTHGSDIYFGEDQFRPESRAGQELLAHELTHTLQQGAAGASTDGDVARRSPLPAVTRDTEGSVRRWALDQGVDLTQIKALRTAGTAQQTFMAKDSTGKEIVIKPGSVSMNLLQLADIVHESVHKTDYIKSYEVDGTQKAVLANKIADDTIATGPSWAASGADTPGPLQGGEDNAGKARRVFSDMVATTGSPLTAMRIVDGKNGKQLSREQGERQNRNGSAMRARLESPMFMRSMGQAAVTDAFTGNTDRFSAGNIGNFMSTGGDNLTLIDNMDYWGARPSFNDQNESAWIPDDLVGFATDRQGKCEEYIDLLLTRIASTENSVEDATSITQWANEPGTNRKRFMRDDMMRGVIEASNAIVKNFSTSKQKSTGRQLKAAIKGIETDDNQVDYWEIMKARAAVLKDPGKADKMVARLKKRNAAAKKKAAKKKK